MFNRKKMIGVAISLCLCSTVSLLNAASNVTQMVKVGDISVISVLDSNFDMESSLIKNGNQDTIKKFMPEGKLPASDNVFIIKNAKQTIMVDAGIGGNLIANLKKVGITPDKIDLILITHGHYDHVIGLIKDGKPVFPKAKILFSEKEKQLYEDKAIEQVPAEYKQYFMPANQVIKAYGNRVETFPFGKVIADGITSVDLSGHTAGQSGFLVESKGQKLLIAGDFLHIGVLQFTHPEYSLAFDSDIEMSVKVRKQTLEKAVSEKILLAGTHIPFPGIGNVTAGFEFIPVK
ncbi:MAG TPA: MBL fold metallo-hydrolase [Chitinispirillaceae bacterium]|nr:MBL fold metallo-hydrolase [Chitinispirillaceae bacterium]